jgi:hypothetical protein
MTADPPRFTVTYVSTKPGVTIFVHARRHILAIRQCEPWLTDVTGLVLMAYGETIRKKTCTFLHTVSLTTLSALFCRVATETGAIRNSPLRSSVYAKCFLIAKLFRIERVAFQFESLWTLIAVERRCKCGQENNKIYLQRIVPSEWRQWKKSKWIFRG